MNRGRIVQILVIAAILVLLFALPTFLKSDYWLSVLISIAIVILLTSSLRTITLIGHFSLGHVGFMLLGAYMSGLLVKEVGVSFWAALVIAGLFPATIALVLGYPFLKVKGVYFAILTLLTGQTFRLIAWSLRTVTGGQLGLLGIPSPNPINVPFIGVISFDTSGGYYYLTLFIVLISLYILYRIEHSELGSLWAVIESNDILARSVGMNVVWLKMVNFTVGCFFAGISGALYAHYWHLLSADSASIFGLLTSIYIIMYMIVGGQSKFVGPIIGVSAIMIIAEFSRFMKEFQPMITAALGVLVVFFMPDGIIGLPEILKKLSKRLLKQLEAHKAQV